MWMWSKCRCADDRMAGRSSSQFRCDWVTTTSMSRPRTSSAATSYTLSGHVKLAPLPP